MHGRQLAAFGTLAMVSGCTICRGCQLDTCHVGIATQIETPEEATEHGLKKFTPQAVGTAAENCARFFFEMGEEVLVNRRARYERTAVDLVGRYDLLEQIAHRDDDLRELITPLHEYLDLEPADLPAADEEPVEARRGGAGAGTPDPDGPEAGLGADRRARRAGCAGVPACASSSRGRPTPTTASSARSSRAQSPRPHLRQRPRGLWDVLAELEFNGGSVAGQGFGAPSNAWGIVVRVEGGAQDGVGKTMLGGTVSIMKGTNREGRRVNGSVGKPFAYGAQRGRLFVQGSADSRFCIRLSGADVVLGGEPAEPIDDSRGCVADRANAKGFAFEYMTSGRAVVLGDIGPWACADDGRRVYTRINPEWNIDRETVESRLGEAAKVTLADLDAEGMLDVQDLLGHYAEELRATDQGDEAERVLALAATAPENFLMVLPHKVQADPNISTE